MADLERGAEAVRLTNADECTEKDTTCYTKEELEELANAGCWNTARKALLVFFWAVWIGAIAWSVYIVVNSPKCAPEPEQAWFTRGAVGLIDAEDPVAAISATEAGQYSAFLIAGFVPPLRELLGSGLIGELREKSLELATVANSKGSKVLFKVDLSNSTEKLGAERFKEYFGGYFAEAADGYVFTGADVDTVNNVRGANQEHDVFYEIKLNELDQVANDRNDNEFFYQALGGDECAEEECIKRASDIVQRTARFANETSTIVEDITETLWMSNDAKGVTSELVLSSALPGGFVIPVVDNTHEDATDLKSLVKLRGELHSLRAIKGASIKFTDYSVERKFDLRPEVTVTTRPIMDKSSEFYSTKSIFSIFKI